MRKKRLNFDALTKHVGKTVDVFFYDHATGDLLIYCKCSGMLAAVLEKHIVICAWDCPEIQDIESRKYNMELFSIYKSTIKQIIVKKDDFVFESSVG